MLTIELNSGEIPFHIGSRVPKLPIALIESISIYGDELDYLYSIDVPRELLVGEKHVKKTRNRDSALVVYGMMLCDDFRKNPLTRENQKPEKPIIKQPIDESLIRFKSQDLSTYPYSGIALRNDQCLYKVYSLDGVSWYWGELVVNEDNKLSDDG